MGKTLYLECYSGISGDMTVAALLDLGADQKHLEAALSGLPVQGFRTEVSRVVKSGLDACDFSVILDHDNHDHDSFSPISGSECFSVSFPDREFPAFCSGCISGQTSKMDNWPGQ